MGAKLPPGTAAGQFAAAFKALEAIVGREWVFASDDDLAPYHDAYGFAVEQRHAPGGAVAPANVEELQAVLRVANEHKLPVWPISRGKNYGYGAAAPCMGGTIVLDLGRMRRILDVDVARGTVLLEPGVGFFDLHEFLEREKIPLWASMPGK